MTSSNDVKITKLAGASNYHTWREKIKHVLVIRDLWFGVIDESIEHLYAPAKDGETKPLTNKTTIEWIKKNLTAASVISVYMDDSQIEKFRDEANEGGSQLWAALENVYNTQTLRG
jgi:hypothetical protein